MTNTTEITMNTNDLADLIRLSNHAAMTINDKQTLVNKQQLVSQIAADMFFADMSYVDSLRVGAAYVQASMQVEDDEEQFKAALMDTFHGSMVTYINPSVGRNSIVAEVVLTEEDMFAKLLEKGYLDDEGNRGQRFHHILKARDEAYMPIHESQLVDGKIPKSLRRHGYWKNIKGSKLSKQVAHIQEASKYTVSQNVLSWATEVVAKTGGVDEDSENYVIQGCKKMVEGEAYVSEFKFDTRFRSYLASAHGPNGQSSDRSRALMDLHGVTNDYNVGEAKEVLRAEIMDMISCSKREVGKYMAQAMKDPVGFIIHYTNVKDDPEQPTVVGKPWSFAKAAHIWKDLVDGKKPYIGMAFGFDAKCSGPQLGALLVSDKIIAEACGFAVGEQEVADAYKLAIQKLEKAGFVGLTRNDVKKPYMGIFYGQGVGAFAGSIPEEMSVSTWNIIHPNGVVTEDRAKAFHRAISASFGASMNSLRKLMKEVGGLATRRTMHYMPDGARVEMNYKIQVNILGQVIDFETPAYDTTVIAGGMSYKFIKASMKTREVATSEFARNGFVNMIQATDALVAKLVAYNANELGVQHFVSIHDCFRVNIHDTAKLQEAIQLTYKQLFGSRTNEKTELLPLGTDILGMYFEGVKEAICDEAITVAIPTVSQFGAKSGNRVLHRIKNHNFLDIVDNLGVGSTCFFAK